MTLQFENICIYVVRILNYKWKIVSCVLLDNDSSFDKLQTILYNLRLGIQSYSMILYETKYRCFSREKTGGTQGSDRTLTPSKQSLIF